MKKLILLSAIFGLFLWFSFAYPAVINPNYSVNWDTVKIFRTDNSNWWYMDINLKDPNTNQWLHFWEVKMNDQVFTYTKQWQWDQEVQMIWWEWSDNKKEFIISTENGLVEVDNSNSTAATATWKDRTVIPVVPKTGPSGTLIWIILATLAIFGGYIYIRKRADI